MVAALRLRAGTGKRHPLLRAAHKLRMQARATERRLRRPGKVIQGVIARSPFPKVRLTGDPWRDEAWRTAARAAAAAGEDFPPYHNAPGTRPRGGLPSPRRRRYVLKGCRP